MNTELNLVVIRSTDIEKSSNFYELLGLIFTKHRHGNSPEHCVCESGSLVFEIYPRQTGLDNTSATRIGFRVTALDALIEKMEADGVDIISRPKASPWGRRAVIADPDGHRVELTEQI